jgi:hypothetical protein
MHQKSHSVTSAMALKLASKNARKTTTKRKSKQRFSLKVKVFIRNKLKHQ